MSELTKLYEEIRMTQNHWRAGNVSQDGAATELKFYKRREQVLKQKIAIKIHGYPDGGKSFRNSMERAQIEDDTEAINLLTIDIENQTIFCPLNKTQMTRSGCLEYSGEEGHYEECKGCEVGMANKRLLTPPIQEHV